MEDLVMPSYFNNIYKGKKVLITGHTGFKGSWLALLLDKLGATVTGFSLKPDTEPAHCNLVKTNIREVIGDLRDASVIKKEMEDCRPDIVFHLAAQPLVRKSYADPIETFETNILGTVNLYEAIRSSENVKAVVNITTDKVYKNNEWVWGYRENDNLGGHDPYSTSKACVELVHECYVKSFFKTAGIFSATARAGNVIGGGDWSQDRLIPDIVIAASQKRRIDIRSPKSVRPWQHVLDPLAGYLLLGQNLLEKRESAEGAWNFGPVMEGCISVQDVIKLFRIHWKDILWNDVSDKKILHESDVLKLDCSKSSQQLKWVPVWDIDTVMEKTANWYKEYYTDGRVSSEEDIEQFLSDAAHASATWVDCI